MRFTHILSAFAVIFAAAACSFTEIDDVQSAPEQSSQFLQVAGRIAQYSDYDVATRSKKEGDEPKVTSMGLALFPINDNGTIGNCLYYDFKLGGSIVFIVDRHDAIFNNYVGKPFAMYIFANMQDAEGFPLTSEAGVGKSLNDYINYATKANTNVGEVPANGFPMMGSLGNTVSTNDADGITLILKPEQTEANVDGLPLVDGAPTDNLEIPLKSLYAKFSFTISVKPDQEIVGNKAPRFDLLKYEVKNIAADVDSNSSTNDNDVIGTSGEISMGNYAQGATTAEFYFYLPERYLSPSKNIDEVLPDALKKGTYDIAVDSDQNGYRDEDEKYHQRFKNKLTEGKSATYVTINGKYTDHQGHTYDVYYEIYLGGNNRDDFNIIRNTHYDNNVTIRGISASDDQAENQEGISIDWRVNVDRSTPLVIGLRRESLLDAHFEVRPLRLRLVGDNIPTGTSATVQILKEDGTSVEIPDWIRLEKSGTGADYISSGVSAGKRNYFTADLVTNTLAGGTSITLYNLSEANQTLWIYVDENNTTTSRAAIVRVSYQGVNKDFKIVQNGLYKVTGADSKRDYYIEQYEEYLYNYDAEDSYGQTKQEGMPWGLNGKQLSKEHYSYDSDELTPNVAWAKYEQEAPRPYYDFYTWEQDSTILKAAGFSRTEDVCHDIAGAGRHFTEVIAKNPNSEVKYITLGEQPTSAVQYCYSRNKRNSDGTIDVKWYLPSADELEDFIVPAYSTFEEFQDNYYWTSQPAYIRNIFYYEYQSSRVSSKTITRPIVYDDNTKYARATKVIYENGEYKPAKSGLDSLPTPIVDNRALNDRGNYEIVGYFYVMHYYKRYYKSVISGVSEEYGSDKTQVQKDKEAGIDVTKGGYDEWYDSKYYVHLGHLENMMQEGYQLRTENNRVRCVRVKPTE